MIEESVSYPYLVPYYGIQIQETQKHTVRIMIRNTAFQKTLFVRYAVMIADDSSLSL